MQPQEIEREIYTREIGRERERKREIKREGDTVNLLWYHNGMVDGDIASLHGDKEIEISRENTQREELQIMRCSQSCKTQRESTHYFNFS